MLVQLSVIRHPYQQSLILDENCITLKAIGKPLSEMFEFRGEWNTSSPDRALYSTVASMSQYVVGSKPCVWDQLFMGPTKYGTILFGPF